MPDNHVKFHSLNGKRRILVVEDEAINRELLGFILQDEYELLYAATGTEALSAVHANAETLSLVLLDLNLPDMHGMDILREIKADFQLARLPVIVLTSDREAEVESLTFGAIDFISKPYPMPEVIRARVLRTIELSEDRDIILSTERDQLTGLYNQEYFYRYAEQYDTFHRDVAMDAIVIDVNHFHMINERYGKAFSDEVLKRIAEHTRDEVKDSGGIVCRHEADTYYIYCPHRADYAAMMDRISADLTDEAHARTRIRLRMGVYSEVDKGIDIERRFDRAKLAANTVRNSFTKAIAIYDNDLHESELFEEHLLDCFPDALKEHQFLVYYQPKFDIRPAEPVLSSAEALVRWKHPELGMVSPGVFVPLFERNGLIQQLDSYVWRTVAEQMQDWKERLGFTVPVSVNVSRVDMYDEDFVSNMQALITEHKLDPHEMLLEITESAYTENSDPIVDTVKRLRDAGFKVEMDDFGAGYSSLNMISALPIDALKLDMQFVRNAFRGRKDTRMLEVILEIADSLMVPSIAEGVETAEQMFALKSMGCDIVQGYYFSRPVPREEFEIFLAARIRQMREGPKAAVTKAEPRRMRSAADMFSYEVMHDPVTGLYNRRAFDLLMEEAASSHIALLLAESRCDGEPDDDARDHAMCRVSEVLCSCFRPVDFICRIGEDRFAVLMTRVNRSHEDLVLSKVEQINDRLAQAEDGAVPVSLRFGVAFCERDEPAAMLFEDAASALAELPEDDPARCAFH